MIPLTIYVSFDMITTFLSSEFFLQSRSRSYAENRTRASPPLPPVSYTVSITVQCSPLPTHFHDQIFPYRGSTTLQLRQYFLHKTKTYNEKLFRVFFYPIFSKSHPPSEDLRYGEEDSISLSTLVLASIKGLGNILYISPDLHEKLALRGT